MRIHGKIFAAIFTILSTALLSSTLLAKTVSIGINGTSGCDPSCDYSSLSSMETGENDDLVTATTDLIVDLYYRGSLDTTSVTWAGWVTNDTYKITLRGAASEPNLGVWDESGRYVHETSNSTGGFWINNAGRIDIVLEDFQGKVVTTATSGSDIYIFGQSAPADSTISVYRSILLGENNSASNGTVKVVSVLDSDIYFTAHNTVNWWYGTKAAPQSNDFNFQIYDHEIINVTAGGAYTAFYGGDVNDASYLFNTICEADTECFSDAFWAAYGQAGDSGHYGYNLCNDAQDRNCSSATNGIESTTLTYNDEANWDFHLDTGSDTAAIDVGYDASSYTTEDIDGNTRPQNLVYDIGADEATPTTETVCNDTIDNDLDTYTDCEDSDCDGETGPSGETCEYGTELTCNDTYDNDADGYADCLDSDCDSVGICEYGTELTCDDSSDNDGDGSTDCSDSDCAADPSCASSGTDSWNGSRWNQPMQRWKTNKW